MTFPSAQATVTDITKIVADVLEVEPHDVTDDADLIDTYEADSLLLIEIASRLEKMYGVEIAQESVAGMRTVLAIHALILESGPGPERTL
jgi:acyl carrier protein